jgi:tripartite-type tricarboxylate transporter receptor subunit TctC
MSLRFTTKTPVVVAAFALAVGTIGIPTVASAVDFSGKKIELIVPYREGGGSDTYARLFAPYMSKYLPGKPTVLIRNFPGGGSIKGSNKFESRAKPDGLTYVVTSSSTMVAQLFGGKKRKFDMLKWKQIVVSSRGTVVYARPSTGATGKDIVADIKMLRGKELLYGAKKANAGELRTIVAFELLGLNVRSIFGLSRGKARKAFMRDELTINHDTAGTYFKKVKKLVKKGQAVPLFTLGYPKGGKVIRDPALPNMPTVPELYTKLNGKAPSGPKWEALKSMLALGITASKGFALPKKTPKAIVKAYINAVKMTMKDKKFLKKAKKRLGPYPQVYGKDAQQAIIDAVTLTPAASKWLKDFLKKKFNVKV